MDELPWWWTVIFSLGSFFGGWFAENALRRARSRALAIRDAAIDTVSFLTCVEAIFDDLAGATPPPLEGSYSQFRAELQRYTSTWEIPEPVTTLSSFLAAQDSEEIHRLAILFFDRVSLFRRRSAEHYEAYMWLLDNTDHEEIAHPAVVERVEILRNHRELMFAYALGTLQFGYELLDVLVNTTTQRGPWHLNSSAFCEFLERRYHLTSRDLAVRRHYYAAAGVTRLLSRTGRALLVRFRVENVALDSLRVRVADVDLEFDPTNLASFPSDAPFEVVGVSDRVLVPLEVDGSALARAQAHGRWGEPTDPIEIVVRKKI